MVSDLTREEENEMRKTSKRKKKGRELKNPPFAQSTLREEYQNSTDGSSGERVCV